MLINISGKRAATTNGIAQKVRDQLKPIYEAVIEQAKNNMTEWHFLNFTQNEDMTNMQRKSVCNKALNTMLMENPNIITRLESNVGNIKTRGYKYKWVTKEEKLKLGHAAYVNKYLTDAQLKIVYDQFKNDEISVAEALSIVNDICTIGGHENWILVSPFTIAAISYDYVSKVCRIMEKLNEKKLLACVQYNSSRAVKMIVRLTFDDSDFEKAYKLIDNNKHNFNYVMERMNIKSSVLVEELFTTDNIEENFDSIVEMAKKKKGVKSLEVRAAEKFAEIKQSKNDNKAVFLQRLKQNNMDNNNITLESALAQIEVLQKTIVEMEETNRQLRQTIENVPALSMEAKDSINDIKEEALEQALLLSHRLNRAFAKARLANPGNVNVTEFQSAMTMCLARFTSAMETL